MLTNLLKTNMLPLIMEVVYKREGKLGWYLEIPARFSSTGKQEKIASIFIMGSWIKLNKELAELLLGDIRKGFIDNPDHKIEISLYKKKDRAPFLLPNFCEKWLASKKDCKPSWKHTLNIYIRTYYGKYFADKDIRMLKRGDIEDFHQWLPDRLSKRYKANIMKALQNLLNDFADWYDQRKLKIPVRMRRIASPPVETISRGTQRIIYNRTPKQFKPIFYFLYFHGLRLGEARALGVKDIFLDKGTVIIRDNFSMDILTTTKTEKEREIPLDPELIGMLRESMPKKGFVFLTPRGTPFTNGNLEYIYKKASKGITTINLYSATRKACATYLAKVKKVDVFTLMEYMGWDRLETARRYVGKVSVQEIKLALADREDEEFITKGGIK